MRILAYNILLGGQERLPRILDIISAADVDILALCECTGMEADSEFATLLATTHLHGIINRAPSGHHVALLYRPSLRPEVEAGSLGMYNGYVSGVFEFPSLGRTAVIASHLHPFSAILRKAELQILIAKARREPHALIVGDFNTIAPGEASAELEAAPPRLVTRLRDDRGTVDTSVIAMALKHGFVDLGVSTAEPTYPTKLQEKLQRYGVRVRVDYMLATSELARLCSRCSPIDDPQTQTASDHLPLFGEFTSP